jgi:SH3 domain protein
MSLKSDTAAALVEKLQYWINSPIMTTPMFKSSILTVLLALLAGAASAETRYITDQLEVTMRSGQSTRNAIVRMLRSGAAVEVLETDAEAGYTKVRVSGGTEGWVLTRFLVSQPVARDRLPQLQQEVATLREQLAALRDTASAAAGENSDLIAERDQFRSDYERTARELEELRVKASNVLQVDQQNQRLNTRVDSLQSEVDRLSMENDDLSSKRTLEWFVVGASVLFVGVLLGLILPRLRMRRRSGWGDL